MKLIGPNNPTSQGGRRKERRDRSKVPNPPRDPLVNIIAFHPGPVRGRLPLLEYATIDVLRANIYSK